VCHEQRLSIDILSLDKTIREHDDYH